MFKSKGYQVGDVVLREANTWGSFLWAYGEIEEGTPVGSGGALVGVVEETGKKRSLVRLITDSKLIPSVRVARGKAQSAFLLSAVDQLLPFLEETDVTPLQKFREKLLGTTGERYLAKGELMGTSRPLWRSRGTFLKGQGFNYDYDDSHGGARDLRSGALKTGGDATPLLQVGDLLVTTGFDGVFPPGLPVATVSKVFPLEEGAPSYQIEAELAAGNLDDLSHVKPLYIEE